MNCGPFFIHKGFFIKRNENEQKGERRKFKRNFYFYKKNKLNNGYEASK